MQQHTSATPSSTPPVPPAGSEAIRFFAVLYRHRLFIMLVVVVSIGISVFAVLNMQNWFSATINLVPPKTSDISGLAGSISSTLKDFGLSKLTGGAADGYSYLVILQSRRLQDSLIREFDLAKAYEVESGRMSDVREALADNLEVTYEKEGNYTVTAWHTDGETAARMANRAAEIANTIANEVVRTEATNNRQYAERRINEIQTSFDQAADSLNKFSRRYGLYSPPEQATAAANAIAELKAQVIQQEMRTSMYESQLGSEDPTVIQQKRLLNDLKQQVAKVENEPGFVGDFSIKGGTAVGVEYLRLMTDVEVFAKMKAFLLPMLEQYKLDEHRSLPNLYVLDPAITPDKKGRPRRSLIVAGTAFGAFVLSVLLVLLWDRYRLFKATYPTIFARKSKNSIEPA